MSAKVTSCFHCSRQKLWHHPDPSSSSQIPYLTHQQIPSPPFLTHPEARSFACSALPLDDAQLLRELLSFPLTSFVSQLKWHLSREPFLVCPIQHDPRLLLYFSSQQELLLDSCTHSLTHIVRTEQGCGCTGSRGPQENLLQGPADPQPPAAAHSESSRCPVFK